MVSILLGTLLRLYHIGDPYLLDFHGWRQSDTASFTLGYLTETMNPVQPTLASFPCEYRKFGFGPVESELPLVAWLAALPLWMLRVSYPPAWYLRSFSILFYLGTCGYLFLLARNLTHSRRIGALSVLAFSVFPISIFFTRVPLPDGPSLFFACGALLHLHRFLTHGAQRHALASSAHTSALLLLKISNGFYLIVCAYLIVKHRGWFSWAKSGLLWTWSAIGILPAVFWYVHASHAPWSFGIWGEKLSRPQDVLSVSAWSVLIQRIPHEILTWSGLVLTVLGLSSRRYRALVVTCSVWLLAFVLFAMLAIRPNVIHVYYQLPLVLPTSLLIAVALARILAVRHRVKWLGLASLALLHGFATINILLYDTHSRGEKGWYKLNHPMSDAVELLHARLPPGARFVSSDQNPGLFYNSGHKGWFSNRSVYSLTSCAGPNAPYLLLDSRTRWSYAHLLQSSPSLRVSYKPIGHTRAYTLFHATVVIDGVSKRR
ncbi:MAG TPA: glycosyltransferase family 39 protein [Polyangiaceae bacterium]